MAAFPDNNSAPTTLQTSSWISNQFAKLSFKKGRRSEENLSDGPENTLTLENEKGQVHALKESLSECGDVILNERLVPVQTSSTTSVDFPTRQRSQTAAAPR